MSNSLPAAGLSLAVEAYSTFAVVRAQGVITAATVADFEVKINAALEGRRSLVLDFTKVSFVSSAGMGVLVVAHGLAKQQGGEIILVGVDHSIKDTFDLFDFGSLFRSFDTIHEAIAVLL
ncbi:MAG: STAS domain-containing protein [Cyanobacteria bacterium NC_groundwater_1444_Ag_S-0.65um_54_12]|nr:STAS domain-containing protein [Cyanobacteria bacterium NC_groundwater_1444_Ag_S-0.65um_54_12]